LTTTTGIAELSDVVITGLRTSFAWAVAAPDNENKYLGQGLYLSCSRGPITITAACSITTAGTSSSRRKRGPRSGTACTARNPARGRLSPTAPSSTTPASAPRSAPAARRTACYWQGNAFPACAFKPNWSVKGSANVATGGRQWDGGGWIGNGGFYSWADVLNISDTVEVYVQQPPPNKLNKEYDAAAFTLSKDYSTHPDWASGNPKMTAAGVTVCGHKQLADFPGPNDPKTIPGVTVRPNAPAPPAWVATAGADLWQAKQPRRT
jgi:hypothetical protein